VKPLSPLRQGRENFATHGSKSLLPRLWGPGLEAARTSLGGLLVDSHDDRGDQVVELTRHVEARISGCLRPVSLDPLDLLATSLRRRTAGCVGAEKLEISR